MYDPLFDRVRNIAFVARPSREGIPRQRSVRTVFSADTEVSPYMHYNYGTKELQISLACVPKLDGVASAYLLLKYTFNLTGAITLPSSTCTKRSSFSRRTTISAPHMTPPSCEASSHGLHGAFGPMSMRNMTLMVHLHPSQPESPSKPHSGEVQ